MVRAASDILGGGTAPLHDAGIRAPPVLLIIGGGEQMINWLVTMSITGDRSVGQPDFSAIGPLGAPPEDREGYIDGERLCSHGRRPTGVASDAIVASLPSWTPCHHGE